MKWTLVTAFLLFSFQGLPPLVGPLIPDTGGVVTGTVRRADSGQPVPEARVAVVREGQSMDQAMIRATITDFNGRFTARAVEPGTYTVIVECEGYFGATGEADGALRTTKTVYVVEGQQIDVGILKMIAGATISGRIAGPDGQPLPAALVEALKPSYIRGRLAFTLVKAVKTDDLGEYRLYWLPPGAYYIRGAYRSNDAGGDRYGRVFFPSIPEEDAAPPVLIRSGSEMSGINIRVPIKPVHGITISGQVTDGASGLAENEDIRVSAVRIVPRDRRVLLVGDDGDDFQNQATDTRQGRFEIRNVPPGEYSLRPLVRDGGRTRTVSVSVNVEDRNIENVAVILEPGFGLQGRVILDGFTSGDAVLKDSIQLVPFEATHDGDAFPINPNADTGSFTVNGLPAGKYALRIASSFRAADTYVADLKRGEASVFDSGVTMGGEAKEPLEVILKSGGGTVSGWVSDPARLRPFPYATVVLVPEKTRRRNLALYKHTLAGENGTFTFSAIPPGEYKLFAWASVTNGNWESVPFLERFEDRGVAVTVTSGAERRTELTVIP